MDLNKYQVYYNKLQNALSDLSSEEILIIETAMINYKLNNKYFIRITSSKYDLADFIDDEETKLFDKYDQALLKLKEKDIISDFKKDVIHGLAHPEVGYTITLT